MQSTYLSFLVALLKVLLTRVRTTMQKPTVKRVMGIAAILAGLAVMAYGIVTGR